MALWKSVENFAALGMDRAADRKPLESRQVKEAGGLEQSLRACSACAGDYEDPDRTARMPDEDEKDFTPGKARSEGQGKVENGTELDGEDRER